MNTYNGIKTSLALTARIAVSASVVILPGCAATSLGSRTYNFQGPSGSPQTASLIVGKADSGEGALVIRTIDGLDTRSDPLLKSAINAAPNLQPPLAPKRVSVDSGEHTIGVLYFLTDALFDDPTKASLLWGKYMTKHYTVEMKQQYAPDLTFEAENRDHVVTVKHYEKLRFTCKAGATCVVYPEFNNEKTSVTLAVKECDSSMNTCRSITSVLLDTKIAVVSNYSFTDI